MRQPVTHESSTRLLNCSRAKRLIEDAWLSGWVFIPQKKRTSLPVIWAQLHLNRSQLHIYQLLNWQTPHQNPPRPPWLGRVSFANKHLSQNN